MGGGSNNAAQQNQAAQQQIGQNTQQAIQQIQNWMAANPFPLTAGKAPTGPEQTAQTFGGGTFGGATGGPTGGQQGGNRGFGVQPIMAVKQPPAGVGPAGTPPPTIPSSPMIPHGGGAGGLHPMGTPQQSLPQPILELLSRISGQGVTGNKGPLL